jgi:PAS domain S-box-containing protein
MSLDVVVERRLGLLQTPLDAVVSAAQEGIVIVDDGQHIVMINPTAQQMFGYASEQILGSPLTRLIPERFRGHHEAHVRAFAESCSDANSVRRGLSLVGLRSDGREFPAQATISRMDVADPNGTRRFFLALLRDLSEERALKNKIHSLEQLLPTITELAPVAIWIVKNDAIVFANHACASLFGIADANELLGLSIYSLLRPESHDTIRSHIQDTLAGLARGKAVPETVASLDGSMREVEIVMVDMPDHGESTLQMVISDVTQRHQEAVLLEQSRRELRNLSANAVEAREEERHRIARELHDELGQRLTALKMDLSSLRVGVEACGYGPRIDTMLEMLDDTVASVRRIAADLRPLMLDDLGLNAAIQWLARDATKRLGFTVSAKLDEGDPQLSSQASIALYRMVQEALTNAARHAHASDVQILMRQVGAEVVLSVHDNGIGFPDKIAMPEGGYGLMGIRERAYMLGGHLEIDNPPGGGGRVCVHLPIAPQADPRPRREQGLAR